MSFNGMMQDEVDRHDVRTFVTQRGDIPINLDVDRLSEARDGLPLIIVL